MTDWGATNDRVAGVLAGCELDMPGEVAQPRGDHLRGRGRAVARRRPDRAVARVLRLVEGDRPGPVRWTRPRTPTPPSGSPSRAPCWPTTAPSRCRNPWESCWSSATASSGCGSVAPGSSLIAPPETVSAKAARPAGRRVLLRALPQPRGVRRSRSGPRLSAAAARADTVLFFGGLETSRRARASTACPLALGGRACAAARRPSPPGRRWCSSSPPARRSRSRTTGSPPCCCSRCPAMRGGEAAAELLLGEANPSGKLTESWPRSAADASCAADFGRDEISAPTRSRSTWATASTPGRDPVVQPVRPRALVHELSSTATSPWRSWTAVSASG